MNALLSTPPHTWRTPLSVSSKRKVILCSPGMFSLPETDQFSTLREIAGEDYEVRTVNLPGHNGHPEAVRGLTIDHYVDHLIGKIKLESVRGSEIILLGHSLGGLISQLAAQRLPVSKVILIASSPIGNMGPWPFNRFKTEALLRLAKYPGAHFGRPVRPNESDERFILGSHWGYKLGWESGWTITELLLAKHKVSALSEPVLVITPQSDQLLQPQVGESIAHLHPKSNHYTVAGDHMVHLGNKALAHQIIEWCENPFIHN